MAQPTKRRASWLWLALPAAARVRPSEHAALMSLYEATSGATWANNEHWDRTKDPCRLNGGPVPHRGFATQPFRTDVRYEPTPWFGVGCIDPCDDYLDGPDCTAGRILSLRLRDNGLSGSLNGWVGIGEMRNITHIDLSYNALSGSIPTEIGQINNLEALILRSNALSGALPTEIADVNANGVGRLAEVSLAVNRLEGTLPAALAQHAPSLLSLDVSNNSLSGTIPPEYADMHALQVLYVHHNALSGSLPSALTGSSGLTSLRYLQLQGNPRLSGTLPSDLGALTALYTLDAVGDALSGSLPTALGGLAALHFLRMNDNAISGSLPTQLGALQRLETLDLYGNRFVGHMPSQLARLINLRLLYLPNEQLLPLRLRYCQQRLPNLGKYSYRLVREEYQRMATSICPEPYDTLTAFGTLSELSGDV